MTEKKNENSKPKTDQKSKPKPILTVCCEAMVKSKGSGKNRKYFCCACGAQVTGKGKPKV